MVLLCSMKHGSFGYRVSGEAFKLLLDMLHFEVVLLGMQDVIQSNGTSYWVRGWVSTNRFMDTQAWATLQVLGRHKTAYIDVTVSVYANMLPPM